LDVGVLGGPVSSDGLPSGHVDLNHGHPGLSEDLLERVMVVEMLSAPLGPQVVEEKTSKNVKRLPKIGETSLVVGEEIKRIVLAFIDDFPEEHERPGDVDVVERLPLFPNFFESSPGALRLRAFEKAMGGRFDLIGVADFALGGYAHELQPCGYREALVEGQPN